LIDLHSHILPGLDDGARTIEDSREIATRAAAEGIVAMAATPHVRSDYPTTAEQMESGVADLRRDFAEADIPVEVLHGAEIALDRIPDMPADELERLSFAQKGAYVLLEFPYHGWPLGLETLIFALRARGPTPILAHPERNAEVARNPERVEVAVRAGALVQLTAASLDGRIGTTSKRTAERLLELRYADIVASDVHAPGMRDGGLAAAVAALGDEGLARYLTEEAPAAVVAGEPLPERPAAARRRRRFWLF
jgi:protein-tyrosine phosphatase